MPQWVRLYSNSIIIKDLQVEEWRPIERWRFYEVSNMGRERSLDRVIERSDGQRQPFSGRVLKPIRLRYRKDGYRAVTLCDFEKQKTQNREIAHLVLETFDGPRPDGMVSRHLNGDRSDNRMANLRWGTQKQNCADRDRHGRTWHPAGEENPRAKLNPEAVKVIRHFYQNGRVVYGMRNRLARAFDVSESLIGQIGRGIVWPKAA